MTSACMYEYVINSYRSIEYKSVPVLVVYNSENRFFYAILFDIMKYSEIVSYDILTFAINLVASYFWSVFISMYT